MKNLTMFGLAVLTIAGCTNTSTLSGDVYSANQAKAVQSVAYGTVLAVRPITIQAGKDSALGTISGAVLGGVLGNTMGGGRGRNITTAVGAIAGGAAGSKIEQAVDRVQGVEIDIKTDDGKNIAVVQKQDISTFHPGQRVRMVGSGRNINVSPL